MEEREGKRREEMEKLHSDLLHRLSHERWMLLSSPCRSTGTVDTGTSRSKPPHIARTKGKVRKRGEGEWEGEVRRERRRHPPRACPSSLTIRATRVGVPVEREPALFFGRFLRNSSDGLREGRIEKGV